MYYICELISIKNKTWKGSKQCCKGEEEIVIFKIGQRSPYLISGILNKFLKEDNFFMSISFAISIILLYENYQYIKNINYSAHNYL